VIVDYKTDEIKDNLEPLTAYYGKQLDLYAAFWQKLTREKVKERVIYFTSIERAIRL
jgi:ATP-dependent exoDNAse (exonuclease V) beta subunit